MLSVEAEHLQLVKKLITAVAVRDGEAVAACMTHDVCMHVPGNTLVSGTFRGLDNVMETLGRIAELGAGSGTRVRIHDVLANDQHGIVMYDVKAERDGQGIAYSHVDVYHFREGKVSEITGCPQDMSAFERLHG
jgi:ketosteroid isomerase-like protein